MIYYSTGEGQGIDPEPLSGGLPEVPKDPWLPWEERIDLNDPTCLACAAELDFLPKGVRRQLIQRSAAGPMLCSWESLGSIRGMSEQDLLRLAQVSRVHCRPLAEPICLILGPHGDSESVGAPGQLGKHAAEALDHYFGMLGEGRNVIVVLEDGELIDPFRAGVSLAKNSASLVQAANRLKISSQAIWEAILSPELDQKVRDCLLETWASQKSKRMNSYWNRNVQKWLRELPETHFLHPSAMVLNREMQARPLKVLFEQAPFESWISNLRRVYYRAERISNWLSGDFNAALRSEYWHIRTLRDSVVKQDMELAQAALRACGAVPLELSDSAIVTLRGALHKTFLLSAFKQLNLNCQVIEYNRVDSPVVKLMELGVHDDEMEEEGRRLLCFSLIEDELLLGTADPGAVDLITPIFKACRSLSADELGDWIEHVARVPFGADDRRSKKNALNWQWFKKHRPELIESLSQHRPRRS